MPLGDSGTPTPISSLSHLIDASLSGVLGGAGSCALLDYPNYDNVGAIAIALAANARLRSMGIRVSYACDHQTYDRDRLASELRRHPGPLLILGGGVFGDQYPEAQRFRERVIGDFRNNAIVQLPQSIHFRGADGVDRARRVIESHPNFVLMVREPESLRFAQREFDTDIRLCPDVAFALDPLERPSNRDRHILWLTAGELGPAPERSSHADPNAKIGDWDVMPRPRWREIRAWCGWWLHRLAGAHRRVPGPVRAFSDRMLPWSFETMGRRKLQRGVELLGSADVVVSDRLHGHILSLLLGIPSVLLDNSHASVNESFYETWTKDIPGTGLAHSVDEAWDLANGLLSSTPDV